MRKPNRRLRLLLPILVVPTLIACANFSTIHPGKPIALEPDEGILIIHTESPTQITRLDFTGGGSISDVDEGTHLRLVVAPAARYRWTKIITPMGLGKYMLKLFDIEMWRFSIEPGKINYPGQLVLEPGYTWGTDLRYLPRSVNRSAIMLRLLLDDFPELLERYPIVYTGHTRDDFLSLYGSIVQEKAADAQASKAR